MIIETIKNSIKYGKDIISEKINKIINKENNEKIIEEMQTLLIESNFGIDITEKIIHKLKTTTKEKMLTEIYEILYDIAVQSEKPLKINTDTKPFVILILGANGAGKTTTIGKISKIYKENNKKVIIAACDTYRAAGIEQLQKICEKIKTPIIKQHYGADSASVAYDAMNLAKKKQYDILIIDTAGRLHTNEKLTEEFKKIIKVIKKTDPSAPHETMLILDSNFGQNSLLQTKKFNESFNITGITITKLDGTSKAGIIIPIINTLNIPIRYLCNGENLENIKTYNAKNFIESLLKN